MNTEEKKTFIEGLNTYYRLKNSYEEKNNKEKRKIMNLDTLSWKERRKQYKMIKPKCINCNKIGGTIFSNTFDKGGRTITAFCGNKENPCPLNIKINLGYIYRLDEDIKEYEKEIENYKKTIIKEKNDLIFGYIDTKQALESFEILKKELQETIEIYESTLDQYLNISDNKSNNSEIISLKEHIYTSTINIKKYISDFNKTQNTQFVIDAVTLYLDELSKELEKLKILLYQTYYVKYDRSNNSFHLIQNKINVSSLEKNLSNNYGVEKFIIGIDEKVKSKKTNKTLKNKEIPFNKTRKNKFIIEPDNEEESEKSEKFEESEQEKQIEEDDLEEELEENE